MLARSHSNDSQLLYSSELLDDILNLNEDEEYNGKQIRNIVRAIKCDSPAWQFETDNKDYFCWQCPFIIIIINRF